MKKKVLMMVLAMTMLAGCGAKEATPTDAGVSDTTVEASTEEVVVDEQDNQEVVQEEVASDTEQVTEEPAVEESSLPENPTEEDFKPAYLYEILTHSDDNSKDAKDENGNTLYSATKMPFEFSIYYGASREVPFDKEFEYVDINGEKWLQVTFSIPSDAESYMGFPLPEQGTDFVVSYSPDFFKVMHNGVVYSATQDYIDHKKQYSPYIKDYNEVDEVINPYYDENGNVIQ